MKAFILSPEAERDLEIIKSYLLEQAGVRVTRSIMRELRAGIRFVATHPEAGHGREDLTGEPVKFWSSRISSSTEQMRSPWKIARVLHGKRDIAEVLE